jgi:hypothetical protein
MFLISDPKMIENIKENFQDPNPPGRKMKVEDAERMTVDYMDRLKIMGRYAKDAPIHFDINLEPVAMIYNIEWFKAIMKQDPAPAFIRIYFGFYKKRHTVLFVGTDADGRDLPAKSGEFYIVEDGTVCCPYGPKGKDCAVQLSLFKTLD